MERDNAANRDAAADALSLGRQLLERGELDRAVRLLRRSYALAPSAATAAAVNDGLRALRADTSGRFCADCAHLRSQCACDREPPPWQGSAPIAVAARWLQRARAALSALLLRVGVSPRYVGMLEALCWAIAALGVARLVVGAPLITLMMPRAGRVDLGGGLSVYAYSGGILPSILLTVAANAILWTVGAARNAGTR